MIHHGNRFVGTGQTITHACVYAEDPGETIEIYFSSGDDTTFGDTRPLPTTRTYTDIIQGGHQHVDLDLDGDVDIDDVIEEVLNFGTVC